MFAREGGEGSELYMEDPEGISQLALHQSEKDLLQMINDSGKFEKIIVLLCVSIWNRSNVLFK